MVSEVRNGSLSLQCLPVQMRCYSKRLRVEKIDEDCQLVVVVTVSDGGEGVGGSI